MPDTNGRPEGTAMKPVLVPADRPYVLVWINNDGYPIISAPVGAFEGCKAAYVLLELARVYVDGMVARHAGAQAHLVVPP